MSEAEATLIEGIGDEVLLFGSLAVTLIAVVFAAFYIQPNVQRRRNSQSQASFAGAILYVTIPATNGSVVTFRILADFIEVARARRDVSPAATVSDHAAGDAAVEDRVQAPQTQLQNDSHAGEPAADEASSAAEDGEPPSQQERTQDDTEASQEEVDPDVIRQRRLEFMQRRAGVEVLGSEEAQREQEREGSSPDADGAAAVDPLGDEEEEAGFSIRLKYLNDTERCVRGRPDETVGSFKRRHFAPELAGQRLVRLIYNGGQLRDDSASLSSCGLSDGCVVHVHVSTAPVVQNAAAPASSNGEGDLNLGALMWPLFAAMLGLLWVLHFQYPGTLQHVHHHGACGDIGGSSAWDCTASTTLSRPCRRLPPIRHHRGVDGLLHLQEDSPGVGEGCGARPLST
ncbi:hypothetical protein HPB48_004678 [Haemaphysalis longicornis]|uniref:Ubiquitin-like domain-containing protein n=1 Tax=Haemaphysalis longicornis TaxID=44386 RepID=A0A9J6G0W9_HAELO|nr:hypothetical protein HPB48_004678 [Haemaphysalis longicornis]